MIAEGAEKEQEDEIYCVEIKQLRDGQYSVSCRCNGWAQNDDCGNYRHLSA